MRIGVISDTHNYIDPRVFPLFEEVELILHAGDIGGEDSITSLEAGAPVKTVYGNMDSFPMTTKYSEVLATEIERVAICMIHQLVDVQDMKIRIAMTTTSKGSPDVLIYGHTHQAKLTRTEGVLLFNPGSAGKRRFNLKPSVGLLTISAGGKVTAEIKYLGVDALTS